MFGRKHGGAPVSLFPFQSLVIGLIGVLLVAVMLFLLRIFQNSAADPAVTARQHQLARLQQEISALRQAAAALPPLAAPDDAETVRLQRQLEAMIRQEQRRIAELSEKCQTLPAAAAIPAPEKSLQVESPDGAPFRIVDCRADGVLVKTPDGERGFPARDGLLTTALAEAADFLAAAPEPLRIVLLVRPASASYAALWKPQLERRLAPCPLTWEPLPVDGEGVRP